MFRANGIRRSNVLRQAYQFHYRMKSNLVNQLSKASSPYLRSHADNPVAWQEWSDETLELAKEEGKPIFLSIGYHTCHWCHVMNKESFSNEIIADILNSKFIPIKLDKEERPDIDSVYMMYLQATKGQGGWPLNAFLVPDTLEPFFAGTYWSGPGIKDRNASFEDILHKLDEIWVNEHEKCVSSAQKTSEQLSKLLKAQSDKSEAREGNFGLKQSIFDDLKQHFEHSFDSVFGGFSSNPKFAMPYNLSVLLRLEKSTTNKESSETDSLTLAPKIFYTLNKIGKGGIKDQIGHGFARYSVTSDWNLPHFEKMLYDQALLLGAYVDAFMYDKGRHRSAEYYVHDIVEFLTRGPLAHPEGGFYSAIDADSIDKHGHHREGAFYVWTYEEFFQALKESGLGRLEADMCAMFWNVSEYGNVDSQFDIQNEFKLQNVLSEHVSISDVAEAFGKKPSEVKRVIEQARRNLRQYRENTRQPPEVDTKIVTAWNGQALSSLSRVSRVFGNQSLLEFVKKTANFLFENSYDKKNHILYRVAGSSIPGVCEDYAFLISGLLELYEATFDTKYLAWAQELQNTQIKEFWDEESGGFYSVSRQNDKLIFRPKNAFDASEPSANGISATNLLRLGSMLKKNEYKNRAIGILECYEKDLKVQPFGYCSMMEAVNMYDKGMKSVIIVAGPDKDSQRFNNFDNMPHTVSTVVQVDSESIKFFKNDPDNFYTKLFESRKPGWTIFSCDDQACRPVTKLEDVEENL